MKKSNIPFFIALLSFSTLSTGKTPSVRLDSTAHHLLLRGIHEVHSEAYWTALKTFDKLTEYQPDHPVGYFGAAAVYKTIMQNYRINKYEPQLDSLLNLTIKIGEQADKKDVLTRFYLGGAYGFRGLHKVRKRDWLGAFNDGLKGLHALQESLDRDPELHDACFGLGTYHYWRSAKARILSFLPFIKNDKKRGIREIWQAIRKGTYTPIECKYALVAIYYDNEEYKKAMAINQELFEQFPTNPSCLYSRGLLFEKFGEWENSKKIYETLLNHILASEWKSIGYQVELLYRLAKCSFQIGDTTEAQHSLEKAYKKRDWYLANGEIEGPVIDYKDILSEMKLLQEKIDMK